LKVMRHLAGVLLLGVVLVAGACAPRGAVTRGVAADESARAVTARSSVASSQIRDVEFASAALGRDMPYVVYLPPGYETSARRYPVLYMLHGMGGSASEWRTYGIFDVADRLIRAGTLTPMIIVLPQGDRAYWVDHAALDKEAWGRYMARDVVGDVDARFRTRADAADRAIGGDSMGAHGALQLALNYPGEFGIVGAHSLVLRRFGSAPAYFGTQADFAKRDPMVIVRAKTDVARGLDLWIDIGDKDPWAPLAEQFHQELAGLGVGHIWHEWPGDHSASYWCAHLAEYLRFYGSAFAGPVTTSRAGRPS
jgi:enterochelin esterase-like enzyme